MNYDNFFLPAENFDESKRFFAEVLNLKCSPDLAMVLVDERQIFKAYHMNKKHWISINLNSKISQKTLFDLIDESFILSK